jgi:hypothetical protein
MKQKGMKAATRELENADSARARSQLRHLHSVNIWMLRSFALFVMKRPYSVTRLEPRFSVADDFRNEQPSSEMLGKLADDYIASGDARFPDFMTRYAGSKNEEAMRRMITSLHEVIPQMSKLWALPDANVRAVGPDAGSMAKPSRFAKLAGFISSRLALSVSEVRGVKGNWQT